MFTNSVVSSFALAFMVTPVSWGYRPVKMEFRAGMDSGLGL